MRRRSLVSHIAQNIVIWAGTVAAVAIASLLALIYHLGWGF